MTTHAHSARRFHGSKEEADAPTCLERDRFSLRTLHPELYANIPSSKLPKPAPVKRRPKPQPRPPVVHVPRQSIAKRIRQWLIDNGPATCPQIAAGLGHKRPENVGERLREGVPDVVVVGTHVPEKGKPVKLWGIKANGIS